MLEDLYGQVGVYVCVCMRMCKYVCVCLVYVCLCAVFLLEESWGLFTK